MARAPVSQDRLLKALQELQKARSGSDRPITDGTISMICFATGSSGHRATIKSLRNALDPQRAVSKVLTQAEQDWLESAARGMPHVSVAELLQTSAVSKAPAPEPQAPGEVETT